MWGGYSIKNKIASWSKIADIDKIAIHCRDGIMITIIQKEEGKLPVIKINTKKKIKKMVEKNTN